MPEPRLRAIDDLPTPPIPEGSSLRHFSKMSVDLAELFNSPQFLSGSHEEIVAFMRLFGASWHQIPAASLPNNEIALSRLSGCNDVVSWRRISSVVLAGWELCSDGRYYHPLVAEEAERALEFSAKQRAKGKKRWPNKLKLKEKDDDATAQPGLDRGSARDSDSETEKEGSKKESKSCERSAESASDPEPPLRPWRQRATPAAAPPPPEPRSEPPQPEPPPEDRSPRKPDHARFTINTGIAFLAEHGKTEQQARPLIGKWRKELNYNDTELFRIFNEARDRADPIAWVCASIRHAKGPVTGSKAPPWTYQEGYCRDVH